MADLAAAPPAPNAIDVDGDTMTSDHSVVAFLELVHDIEPYVDELTWQPTFQRFADLPIELRYEIYELYFNENQARALATENWPAYNHSNEELRRRDSVQFLPRLCLASKELMKEAGTLLLSSLSLSVQGCAADDAIFGQSSAIPES